MIFVAGLNLPKREAGHGTPDVDSPRGFPVGLIEPISQVPPFFRPVVEGLTEQTWS
jgi:hypothetical protein